MIEQRSSGASGYVSVPEAAADLGVEPQAIRRLIRDGELPAKKEIGRWIIPASEVDKRRSLGPRAGRRFSPARAWGLIHLAGGQPAAWLDREARWRMARQLEARPLEALRWQLVARGIAHGYEAHPASVERLRNDPVVMLTGVAGAEAAALGIVGSDEHIEAYVDASRLDDIVKRYHLRPSLEPNVVLRPMPEFGWPSPRPDVAPTVAIALDLLENRDPRARQLGRQLLEQTKK